MTTVLMKKGFTIKDFGKDKAACTRYFHNIAKKDYVKSTSMSFSWDTGTYQVCIIYKEK
jgi:hypothetical protein